MGMETGNASGPLENMDSATGGTGAITLHSLFYAFPVGDLEVTAGPLVDQDDVLLQQHLLIRRFQTRRMPYSLAGNETGPGVGISSLTTTA